MDKNDPRRANQLPPVREQVKSMADMRGMILPVGGYGVAEWHPTSDGSGRPEALLLRMEIAGRFDGMEVIMRIKSREECNRFIQVLERHRDNVWKVDGTYCEDSHHAK